MIPLSKGTPTLFGPHFFSSLSRPRWRYPTGVLTTAVPVLRHGSGQGPMMMMMMMRMRWREVPLQAGWPSLGLLGVPLAPVPAP